MSSDENVMIELSQVWKEYKLGAGQGGLRTALGNLPKRLLRRKLDTPEPFYALKGVDLQVRRGEALGVIGRNGAGKTTILKLISNITQPTRGSIHVGGRISALIELGAGFHPELTGRENIFLNGTILGLSRKEITSRLDEIISFAELEKFIDTPVKRYSSGMYARLGFAVAAHTNPQVLLVDEVLAVGDRNFQEKCFKFIHAFVKGENTTIFVSHNMYVIEQLCNRVAWLEEGSLMKIGTAGEVLPDYFDFLDVQARQMPGEPAGQAGGWLRITSARCLNDTGEPRQEFRMGERVTIELGYACDAPVHRPYFVIGVTGGQNEPVLFIASMLVDGQAPETIEGEGTITCQFQWNPLMPRTYQVWGEVWAEDRTSLLANWQHLSNFRILSEAPTEVEKGWVRHMRSGPPVNIPYEWTFKATDRAR